MASPMPVPPPVMIATCSFERAFWREHARQMYRSRPRSVHATRAPGTASFHEVLLSRHAPRDTRLPRAVSSLRAAARSAPPAASTPRRAEAPARTGVRGPLPPLPVVQYASARPMPVTRAVYEFAARHPDVLQLHPLLLRVRAQRPSQQRRLLHRATQCRRTVRSGSPHGIGCGICIDVARDAVARCTPRARRSRKSGAAIDAEVQGRISDE